ncbi:MAG: L-carnitine dehydrogenase [Rhodospirillaceae bacterium]|nr:L-carnitine dehydrogenase [Rhodospirillaceae bacterium]MBL6941940.1 L-carnitine dehydrogenase [Rhodospirillales bacterium]
MSKIKSVGLLGGGVIGAGWAARCLLNGLDVVVFDPDPDNEKKTAEVLDNARRAYQQISPTSLPSEGSIRFAGSVGEVGETADFVQESLPEREDLKISVLAELCKTLSPDVIIGSSTSGLLPSRIQAGIKGPERFVVGHPFNPVYLMPLVEICGGDVTSQATKEAAMEFYSSIGMRPLLVRKEIDGFIADRLMEALWREALWMINDDVATAEEIDDAMRFGPGLRWAFMGTFMTYRVAGGVGGMRHFMEQFGPTLKLPWTKLMDVPDLTDDLIDKIARQSDEQAGATSIRELERLRDDCLVSVMQALETQNYGAGEVLGQYRVRLQKGDW